MTRVCVAGVTGWTGRAVAAAIVEATDLELISGVARAAAGQTLRATLSRDTPGKVHPTVAQALASTRADVLVDFTGADVVRENALTAVEAGVHLVIGASGLTADDYSELDRLARSHQVGVLAVGNFSVMAAILAQAALLAARHLDHWEIIDYASDRKPDVPSGTSRELAELMAAVRRPQPGLEPPALVGPAEARGAEVAGARIHSVRLPGFVVSTEVVFGGSGERLLLRHDPGPEPNPYVEGTLLAIRRVGEVYGLRRGLATVLSY
jgi:4-hydroxy-tetrahydrodipicolinate reductase